VHILKDPVCFFVYYIIKPSFIIFQKPTVYSSVMELVVLVAMSVILVWVATFFSFTELSFDALKSTDVWWFRMLSLLVILTVCHHTHLLLGIYLAILYVSLSSAHSTADIQRAV
jgi:hypothetical protein